MLWFTYCKAVLNSVLSQLGMKVLAFKATTKTTAEATVLAPAVVKAGPANNTVSGDGSALPAGCCCLPHRQVQCHAMEPP